VNQIPPFKRSANTLFYCCKHIYSFISGASVKTLYPIYRTTKCTI